MADWQDDPYYTHTLEPGWTLGRYGPHVHERASDDRRPPVSRVEAKFAGTHQKNIELPHREGGKVAVAPVVEGRPRTGTKLDPLVPRERRGEAFVPEAGPPANRKSR